MQTRTGTRAISKILDQLEAAGDGESLSVGDIVAHLGQRSFAPLLLVPALLLVSPLSSIPGAPTITGIIILLISVQMLMGRRNLWLPRFIERRSVAPRRMASAVRFLRRPVEWTESGIRPRLLFLTSRPASLLVLATCVMIAVVIPAMEVIPMLSSVAALAVALFAVGLLTEDGVFILLGFAIVALAILAAISLF